MLLSNSASILNNSNPKIESLQEMKLNICVESILSPKKKKSNTKKDKKKFYLFIYLIFFYLLYNILFYFIFILFFNSFYKLKKINF